MEISTNLSKLSPQGVDLTVGRSSYNYSPEILNLGYHGNDKEEQHALLMPDIPQ